MIKPFIKFISRCFNSSSFIRKVCELIINVRSFENNNFLKSSYTSRANLVKELHSSFEKRKLTHAKENITSSQVKKKFNHLRRFADDFILSYAKIFKPKTILQLGCWHMGEILILKSFGFKGNLVASDQSTEFLEILREKYKNTFLKNVIYKKFDIENPNIAVLKDVQMISAIQVLSNIQPEGIESFFKVLSNSSVRILIVGDMFTDNSLSGSFELSKKNLNWNHPYIRLSKKNNLDCFFLPDISFSNIDERRGVFIISKKIGNSIHREVMAEACQNFIKRQLNFLS